MRSPIAARRLALAVLALVLAGVRPAQAGKVYWTAFWEGEWRIRRANLNGTDAQTVYTHDVNGQDLAQDIAFDPTHRRMYWIVGGSFPGPPWWIYRSDLDGNGVEQVVTLTSTHSTLYSPHLAIDAAAGKLYWSQRYDDAIFRADLDGTDVELVIETQLPLDLAIDPGAGKLYWTSFYDGILWASLDGTAVESLVNEAGSERGLALDLARSKLYWGNPAGAIDFIRRANLDGSAAETVLVTDFLRGGLELDSSAQKVYWLGSDAINRANFDGSEVETISHEDPWDIALAIIGACGDGVLDALEECDDGNTLGGDGCQPECLIPECGDGIVDDGEACDEAGDSPSCDGDCTAVVCGDGYRNEHAGEQCDDGNTVDGDGCQATCLFPRCGDGIVDAGEQCDDGNAMSGDGCEPDCTVTAVPALSLPAAVIAASLLLVAGTRLRSRRAHRHLRPPA